MLKLQFRRSVANPASSQRQELQRVTFGVQNVHDTVGVADASSKVLGFGGPPTLEISHDELRIWANKRQRAAMHLIIRPTQSSMKLKALLER